MPKNLTTHIYCFDDHRRFTEEIRKKFDDPSRYIIHSFQTRDEMIDWFFKEKENSSCKIAIIGVHDSEEQSELTDQLVTGILKSDPRTGIILLCPPEKIVEMKKIMKFNIDAYIPQNANFVLRVHNVAKKHFSEHNIRLHRKLRNRSLLALLTFIVFSVVLIIFARLRFPELF